MFLGFEIPLSTNLKMSLKPRPVPGLQDPNKGFYPLKRNPEIIILGRYKDGIRARLCNSGTQGSSVCFGKPPMDFERFESVLKGQNELNMPNSI